MSIKETRNLNVGIDIGGTFTDVVLMDDRGNIISKHKVDTTPTEPELCFVNGLKRAANGTATDDIGRILHATTVATNTVLEGKGAKTGLIVTEGFRDILEIARQRRPSLYDLKAEKAKPLVPRQFCWEIRERIMSDGTVHIPLDETQLSSLADTVRRSKVESVVISLLFSYLNPGHEQRIRDYLAAALPDIVVVASSDVIPEFREFERTSTAVLVGYLKPIFARYAQKVIQKLEGLGHASEKLLIMNSAGGLTSAFSAGERPHAIVESGPAAGVIAVARLAAELGEKNVISFDMGGTTAKASLIENGAYRTTTEYEIGAGLHQSLAMRFTGYPIKAPMIDLTECSAGGGSIASVDPLGLLKVGPRSAGADPGPACYGRGGTEPTVTDANLVLGRINPDYFVGGETRLDLARAQQAIETKIARPLGLSVIEAAAGIVAIVNAHMTRILRVVSVARGLDPREFALVAFGGAGPLHAAELASDLRIPKVIVPEAPGVFSALGLLWADLRSDFSRTVRREITPGSIGELADMTASLEAEAKAWLEGERLPKERWQLQHSGDMRYPLQNYEINVPLPQGPIDSRWVEKTCEAFHAAHEKLYGYCDRAEKVLAINLRIAAVGLSGRRGVPKIAEGGQEASAACKASRKVYFHEAGGMVDCPIYEREKLRAGNRFQGPGIVEQADSTIVVPPSFVAEVDPHGRLMMTTV